MEARAFQFCRYRHGRSLAIEIDLARGTYRIFSGASPENTLPKAPIAGITRAFRAFSCHVAQATAPMSAAKVSSRVGNSHASAVGRKFRCFFDRTLVHIDQDRVLAARMKSVVATNLLFRRRSRSAASHSWNVFRRRAWTLGLVLDCGHASVETEHLDHRGLLLMTKAQTSTIDAEQWARIKDHVADLSAMDTVDRAKTLLTLPLDAGDRSCIERLIAPLSTKDERLLKPHPSARSAADEGVVRCRPGDLVGRYRIQGLLGRGGMGEVYGASLGGGQVVALKVLKSGLAQSDYARFSENEQRALRRLDDHRIAKFIEAFVAPEVGTCLVLEYVDGEPLQTYCRGRRFNADARLKLFIDVCQAVASAHQQLVVHRDLKPSNVLVTPDGQVKLLDFGVSKLLDDETPHTQTYGNLFTLDYAAPEQVLHEPVSAATDIYALGVLLYRLLTDVSPYALQDGGTLAKAVLNDSPQRIARGIERARATGQTPPAAHVDRDLDRIVARAMEKVPRHRYGSALALAADVQSILDGRPIVGGGGASYRIRKFATRNPAGVTAGLVVTIAMIVATVVSVQYARQAGLQVHRAEVTNRFLLTALDLSDRFSDKNRGDFTLDEVLERAVAKAHADLKDEPQVRADVLLQLSYALQHLGKLAAALPAAREALDIRAGGKPSFAIGTPEARWACGTCSARPKGGRGIERAAAAQQLASIEIEIGQLANAKRHLDETLAYLSDAESDDVVRIEAYSSLGKLASMRGDAEDSLRWYEQIPPLRKSLPGDHETDLAMDYNNLGTGLYNLSRFRESEEAYTRAIELLKKQSGDSHPKLEFVQYNRIPPLIQLGRFKEARVLLEAAEVVRSVRGGSAGDTPSSVPTERLRALLDYYASDYTSALYRLGMALPQTRLSSPASVAEALALRGRVELANGDPTAAAKSFEQADEMLVKEGPSEHLQHWYARGLLGVARAANGEIETGDALLDEALIHLTGNGVQGSAEQIEISLYTGAAARRRGEIAIALVHHRRADSMQKELGWLGDLGAARVDAELAQDGLAAGADAESHATAGARLASAISALRSISANDRVLATLTALQSTAAGN